ncbi:hypothetical protein [Actinopolymorpha pittospori]|uniref:Uncharacterized protein n=1 Tax=Actinopolymorpha pittospori TaxID=648752 RepID=A0A927RQI0_9ACTN|nr:hypothetical protein [Actinopolymorpha pittospori]MBE1612258.1 hypothetical protein [Actinopolymorpha pittospori]
MPLNEIAASLYAWDLADEGVDRCLDNLEALAGVNSAYLVGLMHKEKRPLHARFYPHNPVRKYYTPEDSRAYWIPRPEAYPGRIKPMTSSREFLAGTDWLDTLVESARSRGMKTGCEISHTILDAQVAREQYADVLQRDVFGNSVGTFEAVEAQRALPCLNNPDVQEYLVGLVTDLAANHDIDFIQSCLVMFGSGFRSSNTVSASSKPAGWTAVMAVATGGCFCAACEAKARAQGLDWEEVLRQSRHLAMVSTGRDLEEAHEGTLLRESNYSETELLLENDAFAAWLLFRRRSIDDLFRVISEAIHAARPEVDFRYNTYMSQPELAGLNFRSAFEYVDSVRESDYSDQLGTPEGVAVKRAKLMKARRALGYDKPLLAALGVRPNATPETLRASVKAAVDAGCDGLSLGHYDGATMERLRAVATGMREWEALEEDWIHKPGEKATT